MNAYDLKQLQKVRPLTEKETKLIFDNGVVTGSTVFGSTTNHISDINILLYNFDFEQIKDFEKKLYEPLSPPSEYDDRLIFYAMSHKNEKLNLLIFKDKKEFRTWARTTQIMIKLNEFRFMHKFLDSRPIRIKLFKYFREQILNAKI